MARRTVRGMMPCRRQEGETALYRFFDETGTLLYIGIADEPMRRWYGHTLRSWWQDVASFEVAWHASRSEAEQAEAKAIAAERPVHNVRFNRERGDARSGGSPVLTEIVLSAFQGRQFTALEVARESGFSTTSARNTMRALVASGRALLVGDAKTGEPRVYSLTNAVGLVE